MGFDLSFIGDFIAAHSAWAIPIAFLIVFAESFAFLSLLVPGTAIMATFGALIGTGTLSAWELLLGAIPGAILGDAISFGLGRRYGGAITRAWPMRDYPEMVARGEDILRRHGIVALFIGRFFGPLRAVVPLLAGMAGMRAGPFWAVNIASAVIWAPAIMLPGALLGWAVERSEGADRWIIIGAALAGCAAVAFVLHRVRARS